MTFDNSRYMRMEPLDLSQHLDALYAVSNGDALNIGTREVEAYDPDERIWRYMSGGPFASTEGAWGVAAPANRSSQWPGAVCHRF
ncbi:MAG: hypothetical protein U0694_13315 [Anaerolineae bacterium]